VISLIGIVIRSAQAEKAAHRDDGRRYRRTFAANQLFYFAEDSVVRIEMASEKFACPNAARQLDSSIALVGVSPARCDGRNRLACRRRNLDERRGRNR
jgi:hypothetical protein